MNKSFCYENGFECSFISRDGKEASCEFCGAMLSEYLASGELPKSIRTYEIKKINKDK